jgi:PKD repeat protein
MKLSSQLLVSPAVRMALIPTIVVVVAIILMAPNTITITNAQQPPLNGQLTVTQNRTTLFQSAEDGVRLNVPADWVIHDVNNTGSMLSQESTQGYAILAQLCPQEEEVQEQTVLSNVSVSGNTTTSCQGSEGEVIHIVRYPDLDTRLFANNVTNNTTTTTTTANNNTMTATTDNVLTYHLQKLEEVGYRSMQVVNSTDMRLNVINTQTNQTISTVPAQFVEMIYNTASAPNETREGYFILTATNATQPNVGTTKGYSIFYEGTSTAASTVATIQETTATTPPTPSGSLEPTLLPALVRHMFESFELIAAPEVIQDMLAAQAQQVQEEPTNPLTVQITSSDTEGEAIAPATFEFEADVVGGTEPYTYNWDFDGEGSGSGEGNEQAVEHTFEEAGSYDVSLTVTDSGGQSATDSMEISVEEEVEEEEEEPPAEEEVEEVVEEEPIPPAEEEIEEEVQEQRSLADEIAENIEDEVDAFVDDFLARYGINN